MTEEQLRNMTDVEIQELMDCKAAAVFPAHLAVVQVQAANYDSWYLRQQGYHVRGSGAYTVLAVRDVETDDDFARIAALPMIRQLGPINSMLIPARLDTVRDLRVAAAPLKADILLVYTFDTVFRVKDHDVGPLNLIALGFLPNQEARVSCTASAALFDVRTGYLYGLCEATAAEKQSASIWSSEQAVDDSRKRAERAAFGKLLDEFEKTWKGVVETYAAQK